MHLLRAALVDGRGQPLLLVVLFLDGDGRPCTVAAAVPDRHGLLTTVIIVDLNIGQAGAARLPPAVSRPRVPPVNLALPPALLLRCLAFLAPAPPIRRFSVLAPPPALLLRRLVILAPAQPVRRLGAPVSPPPVLLRRLAALAPAQPVRRLAVLAPAQLVRRLGDPAPPARVLLRRLAILAPALPVPQFGVPAAPPPVLVHRLGVLSPESPLTGLGVPATRPALLQPQLAVLEPAAPVPGLAVPAPPPPLPRLGLPAPPPPRLVRHIAELSPAPPLVRLDVPARPPALLMRYLHVLATAPPLARLDVSALVQPPVRRHLHVPAPAPLGPWRGSIPEKKASWIALEEPGVPLLPPGGPPPLFPPDSTRPPSLSPLVQIQQLLELFLKNNNFHDEARSRRLTHHSEMVKLQKDDSVLSEMEAGLLHRHRNDRHISQSFAELIQSMQPLQDMPENTSEISELCDIVEGILSKLPENVKKDLLAREMQGIRNPRDQSRKSKQTMLLTFASSVILSIASHLALYFLSIHLPSGENTKEESESPRPSAKENKMMFVAWGLEKLVIPFIICGMLTTIKEFIINKEIYRLKFKANEKANLWINSVAKAAFFAIKEFPATRGSLVLWAHLVCFAIEFAGAMYLLLGFGYWDADVADS